MDKTWVHHFTRDKVTIEALETPSFSAFQGRSAGKVMASIFWDAEGVLLVDSQDKGHTIIWAYYADFFLNSYGWKSSRFDLEVFIHQDSAPAYRSTVAMAAIQKYGFQLVKDPPYSPDLAPSDYYLFPKMK